MMIPPIDHADGEPRPTPSVVELAEHIHRRWAARVANDSSVYCVLMVDPTLRDAADEPWYRTCSERWAKVALVQSPEKLATPIRWSHPGLKPEHRPQLIALALDRYASSDLLQASLAIALEDQQLESRQRGEGNRISGWLLTSCFVDRLAMHLGAAAVQRLPVDYPGKANKRVLLRYFDPNVMPALWNLSTALQRDILLGPIQEWIMLDPSGKLQSYLQHASGANDKTVAIAAGHIGYSTAQWMALNSIGALNHVLMRLESRERDGTPLTANAAEVASRALARARAAGISDQKDLQAFAWHALTVNTYFDTHTMIARCIQSLQDGAHEFYTAAVAELTPDDWDHIRFDMREKEKIV